MSRHTSLLRAALFSLSLTSAPTLSSAIPNTTKRPDRVVSVTLLSDRAEVTREQVGRCARAGASLNLTFSSLPSQLLRETLRASAEQGAEVVGVSYLTQSTATPPSPPTVSSKERGTLNEALAKRYAERQRLERSMSSVNGRIEQLIVGARSGLLKGNLKPKLLEQHIDKIRVERVRQMERMEALNLAIHTLNAELAKLDQAEQSQVVRPQASGGEAQVSLTCKGAGEVKVSLMYVTSGASWTPDYHVHVSHSSSKSQGEVQVRLGVNATIQQATGEDWEGVKLTLSTAQPNLGDYAPLPAPLKVYGEEHQRPKVLVQGQSDRSQLSEGGDVQAPSDSSVAIDDRGQSFALTVPGTLTVQSHGRPYWVPVSESKGSGRVSLVSTPKLSPHVFRVARFKSPAGHPLMSAPVSLTFNGTFLGQATLDYTGSGEPIELSLGLEERLRISRELVKAKDESAGLLSSDRTMMRRFKILVKSVYDKPLKVEVLDNIPISEVSDLKVKLDKKQTTEGFKLDPVTGFVRWELKVKPAEERRLDFVYQLTLPEDWKTE